MMLSPALIGRLLAAHPALGRLWVAFSGGVDSHALLHLLASQRAVLAGRELAAVYVDHGLHPASAAWGDHCEEIGHGLGVSVHRVRVDARPAPGESPEAAARLARYRVLEALLREDDALLTAHHRDDQAETLLLQLLRGGGPHGLAAMPDSAPLGRGLLLRPLLEVERADILAYAQIHGLMWIEDSSNLDHRLDRNYLRHEILPRLRSRWPGAARALARSARLCAEAADNLDALADADLARAGTDRADRLAIPILRPLQPSRQRNALRRWFRRLLLPSPGAAHMCHILNDALAAPRDRQPLIRWPGCEVRRYRDHLYALAPRPPFDARQVHALSPPTERLVIPGVGYLKVQPAQGQGIRLQGPRNAILTIRFRQGGEVLRPAGCTQDRTLKNLLQEAGVPPWERERLPLLYVDDALAAVIGLTVAAEFAAAPDEIGLVVTISSRS